MKEYICTVCGYVHKTEGELPEDFKCPVCGAGRDAFRLKEETPAKDALPVKPRQTPEKPHTETELSPMELSIVCSNLARGCEKQYLPDQSELFRKLAEFFRAQATPANEPSTQRLLDLIEQDLTSGFPHGTAAAQSHADRGALRCQVWAEKVTRMLQSLLSRYQTEGEKMLEHTGVYVCSICGFVFIGDTPPEICPVCKVPAWKFEKLNGGTNGWLKNTL